MGEITPAVRSNRQFRAALRSIGLMRGNNWFSCWQEAGLLSPAVCPNVPAKLRSCGAVHRIGEFWTACRSWDRANWMCIYIAVGCAIKCHRHLHSSATPSFSEASCKYRQIIAYRMRAAVYRRDARVPVSAEWQWLTACDHGIVTDCDFLDF